jgi:hypothetical protein
VGRDEDGKKPDWGGIFWGYQLVVANLSQGVINEHIGNAEDIDFIEFNKLKKLQKQCNLT